MKTPIEIENLYFRPFKYDRSEGLIYDAHDQIVILNDPLDDSWPQHLFMQFVCDVLNEHYEEKHP